MEKEKNKKIDKLDDLVKGIKKYKKEDGKSILPINNQDLIYKFSVDRYIKDCEKREIKPEITAQRVEKWAKGYEGKIAIGNMVYDDNGIGIPAYEEWCVLVSKKEYVQYLRKINILGTRE